MIEVTLTWFEMMLAAQVGIRRHIAALQAARKDRYGCNGSELGWQQHIEGACGECAYAKATGRYWSGSVDTFKSEGDVGSVQIRTRSRHDYELIVRDDDDDDATFVLVTGTAPTYRIVGEIQARHAKQSEWKKTHGQREAAYFVPHVALRDTLTRGEFTR